MITFDDINLGIWVLAYGFVGLVLTAIVFTTVAVGKAIVAFAHQHDGRVIARECQMFRGKGYSDQTSMILASYKARTMGYHYFGGDIEVWYQKEFKSSIWDYQKSFAEEVQDQFLAFNQ